MRWLGTCENGAAEYWALGYWPEMRGANAPRFLCAQVSGSHADAERLSLSMGDRKRSGG
jgi:hypothetical protein